MKIAVARDEAFNFTYRENIDRLREIGEVIFFSPIPLLFTLFTWWLSRVFLERTECKHLHADIHPRLY